jgi:hypothetical protein
MTDRKDLKRRVRDRQSETGESYMTALRHVRGDRVQVVPVVEMVDVSEIGAALGIKCRTLMVPGLAEQLDVSALLSQLRAALVATTRDAASELMRGIVLYGERPFAPNTFRFDETLKFQRRVRAGIGGFSESGRSLSLAAAGRRGVELVIFSVWTTPVRYVAAPPSLIITSVNEPLGLLDRGLDLLPFGLVLRAP